MRCGYRNRRVTSEDLADPKRLLRYATDVRGRVARVLDLLAERRLEAADALSSHRADTVARQLADIPIERLREVTDERLRIAPLRDAGYRTVSDVYRASIEDLDAVPNIGEATAAQLVAAANQIARAVQRSVADAVRLDPDRRDESATQLLRSVDRFEQARRETAPVHADAAELSVQLDTLLAVARPARSKVRLFFTFGKKKQAANDAVDAITRLLATPRAQALATRVRAIEDTLDDQNEAARADDELWHRYERNAGAVIAAVEQIDAATPRRGVRARPDAVDLPDEIVDEINAFELDVRSLTVALRGYQVFGAKFALVQGRAILGDEMGLGKTIQAIAAIAHLAAGGESHFLVVCPATVLVNWTHEIAKHSALTSHRVHGDGRDATVESWIAEGGVAVTTFETLRLLDLPDEIPIAMVVVDEAHYVKNADALRSRAIGALAARVERVLFMSGTPMENRVEEFRTLVGYLHPELASGLDAADGVAGADAFRKAVAPVYLRRNQDDVLTELPERIEQEDWVELSPADAAAYRDAVASGNFMAMRRAAFDAADVERSAKLGRLAQILADAAEDGHKVVVFSYFLDVLDTVHRLARPHAFGPLTGSVSPVDRQALVDRFSEADGYAVLVSQIQAGGVGLNIQAASVVVLTEPQWKPSTEEQAIARCHRMGQSRPVQVHRLLAEDCVDALILEVVQAKRVLFDEYARESDLKDVAPDAVDVSAVDVSAVDVNEVRVAQAIVAAERQRLLPVAHGDRGPN